VIDPLSRLGSQPRSSWLRRTLIGSKERHHLCNACKGGGIDGWEGPLLLSGYDRELTSREAEIRRKENLRRKKERKKKMLIWSFPGNQPICISAYRSICLHPGNIFCSFFMIITCLHNGRHRSQLIS
jgi:hypothetical protein